MTKCVYCACTADIEAGKDYCRECGHDAVAHVAAAASAGGGLGLKLLIVAGAVVAVYFFLNSQPDGIGGIPSSAGVEAPATVPADAAPIPAPSSSDVYTLPPPTVQPNGQVLPAAPPLGSWQSYPGAAQTGTPNPGTSDQAPR